jgi:hypothetical protein
VGNRLIYADTYEQALTMLAGSGGSNTNNAAPVPAAAAAAAALAPEPPSTDPRIQSIRQHLQRYRELASQGKWAEAGRELDAIQAEANK